MLRRLFIAFFLFVVYLSYGQHSYRYQVDLVNVEEDKVKVVLEVPKISSNKIRFYFAKIVPGTYREYDFGRFITGFEAVDQNGAALPVSKGDQNTYEISGARGLKTIRYQVDDTFDGISGTGISGMSGTNIVAGEAYLINGHGFFGYFDGMQDVPYEIRVIKEGDLKGSSAIDHINSDGLDDIYFLESYNDVVDNPMLYSRPDHTHIEVGNCDVLVSVFSASGNVTSSFLARELAGLLNVQKEYMGGQLPVDRYAFLMYFLQSGEDVGTGALEHNYSSLYVLPDYPQSQIIQPILNISAHEFFHIITPLNIHSKEIHNFDFNDPKMSRHLWMYEGVTEYFSHHSQLVGGMITLEEFLAEMSSKTTDSRVNYIDSLSFTDFSRGCLKEYRNQYANVYQKGALIGLCLDILLRKHSGGTIGLIDLMLTLGDQYGKDQPFKDRTLFKKITKQTFPEVGAFLNRYVDGNEPLPLRELFHEIGIDFNDVEPFMGYSLGNVSLGFNSETGRIYVSSTADLNTFGRKMKYQVGDEFVRINGKSVPEDNLQAYFDLVKAEMVEGEILSVEIYREGKLIDLRGQIEKVGQHHPASLKVMPAASKEQMKLRQQWLQGAQRRQ